MRSRWALTISIPRWCGLQLGNIRYRQLRQAEALDIFTRALDVLRRSPGQADIMVPVTLNNIAEVYQAQGQLALAEGRFLEALDLQQKQQGRDSIYVAATLNNLGELRRLQGRLAEAEELARRTLEIRQKALGPNHPDVAASLNNLALVFSRQDREDEAAGLLVRAFGIQEKAFGPQHPNVATALNNLAQAWSGAGRKQEAEQVLRRSLAIREKSLGPSHLDVAITLDNLVALICDDEHYADAEPLARRSLAIREAALGQTHPLVANSLNNLAVIMDGMGRPREAEPLLVRAIDIRQRMLGEAHPDVANSFANLGAHYLDLKDWPRGRDAFARASAILKSSRAGNSVEAPAQADLKIHRDTNPYPGIVVADYNLAGAAGQQAAALQAEAFEAAQWIGDDQAARAIAGMSARISQGAGDLAARVRERQDLNQQALATDKTLVGLLLQPTSLRNEQMEQALRARASAIARQIGDLDRALATQFPGYAALVTKTPVSIADVQKLLGPKEALLLFTTTAHYTFVWTITGADVRWHAAALGEKQLAETVGILRCGLDADAWADKAASCSEKHGLKRPAAAGEQLPFDQERAFALYQALFGPVARASTARN